MMNETISLLMNHRSIRKFTTEQVTDDQLTTIIAAAQMASTSSNVQAYSVIAVTDTEKKQRLAELAGNQAYIVECPVFLVWCADLYRLKKSTQAYTEGKETFEDTTENFLVASMDTALAAQNAAVAAESLGMGIVYIGGIRNQIAQVAELLQLPELVYPVFGMCVGFPDQEPGQRPRLTQDAVLHRNTYDATKTVEQVKVYDETMVAYLQKRTGGEKSTPWSEIMADRLAKPARIHMKSFLESKGFLRK